MPAGGRVDCRGGVGSRREREHAATAGCGRRNAGTAPIAIQADGTATGVAEAPESFVPVPLPASPPTRLIRIEVRRKSRRVSIEWPASAARRVRGAAARAHEVIRVDAAWFAIEPLDMRAGVDTALARVVNVFGEARAHHAYLFVNKRAIA